MNLKVTPWGHILSHHALPKTFFPTSHYWQLWRIKLLETSYWTQKAKKPRPKPLLKTVCYGSIPTMGTRRPSKPAVPSMKASLCWWAWPDLLSIFHFPECLCSHKRLPVPYYRSFLRWKTQRSAWLTSILYMKTSCPLLPTTMSFWLNLIPMSGRWRAGLSAPSLVEEVRHPLNESSESQSFNYYKKDTGRRLAPWRLSHTHSNFHQIPPFHDHVQVLPNIHPDTNFHNYVGNTNIYRFIQGKRKPASGNYAFLCL